MDYLSFTANNSVDYAVDVLDVVSVIDSPKLTRVFGTPLTVAGITQHRGRIIAVVDLSQGSQQASLMIVVKGRSEYGILAQQVREIARDTMPELHSLLNVGQLEQDILLGNAATA